MSRHTEQLASTIQRDLQNLLVRGLQDPRVKGLITVTGVRVTDDLTAAIVTVSVLPAEQQDLTMHGLRAAAGFLRRALGKTVQTRRLPPRQFQVAASLKRGAEVLAAIDRVRAERLAKEAAGAGETTEDAES